MSWLSELHTAAAPIVATFSPEPVSRAAAQQKVRMDQEKKAKEQQLIYEQQQAERNKKAMEYFSQVPMDRQQNINLQSSTQSSGGGFLDSITGFFGDAGTAISSAFSSGIPQMFGLARPPGVRQQPAITTVTNVGARETQGSGTIQAGMGLLPTIGQLGSRFLRSPGGGFGLGTAIGAIPGMFDSSGKQRRITRKMKSQARMVLNMTGGNLEQAASILNISRDVLIMVLLKRFRNDGAVVTKAALRKTKSTVRKLKNMCDMYDDLRPTARRRAPVRRMGARTTLIKN